MHEKLRILRKKANRQYAQYNTHGESPLMSRLLYHQMHECTEDNQHIWHDSQYFYENMNSNIRRSDYLNPFTRKAFDTVEELANAAEVGYQNAKERAEERYKATGSYKPPFETLKARQRKLMRSWHVVTDLPTDVTRREAFVHSGFDFGWR